MGHPSNHLDNSAEQYVYDDIYQLQQVTRNNAVSEAYTYDKVGNRLSSLGVATYNYNSSNQLTSSSDGVTYTYDNNGNTLTKTDAAELTQYGWDYENRLTSVTLPGGPVVTFKYDPFGRRIQKASAAGVSNYLYDGANITEEVDAAGLVQARYAQGPEIDEPVAMLRSGNLDFFAADGLGSVTSLTDASGTIGASYTYESFGSLLSTTGTLANPVRYTAREYDAETGMYYYRARYYDPKTGRFISADPVGFASGDANFYRYVRNNPASSLDPWGLAAQPIPQPVFEVIEGGLSRAGWFARLLPRLLPALETLGTVSPLLAVGPKDPGMSAFADSVAGKIAPQAGKGCKGGGGDPCKGLRDQLAAHQAKLQQYVRDPYANDNLGILGRGYDQSIIAGRVKHLVHEILELNKQLEECERLHGQR